MQVNFILIAIELNHFLEKSDLLVSDMINCGVYLFSPLIFEQEELTDIGRRYAKIMELSKEEKTISKLSK